MAESISITDETESDSHVTITVIKEYDGWHWTATGINQYGYNVGATSGPFKKKRQAKRDAKDSLWQWPAALYTFQVVMSRYTVAAKDLDSE